MPSERASAAGAVSRCPGPRLRWSVRLRGYDRAGRIRYQHFGRLDDLTVGAEVPRNLHFYPFPKQVAEIAPEYGGYFYVVAAEKIVVIDPLSYRIVAILPV